MRTKKYLQYILPFYNIDRTKQIFHVNPTIIPKREDSKDTKIYVYDYVESELHEYEIENIEDSLQFRDNNNISWINIDGLRKHDVELICNHFKIHPLIIEDILSVGQRPKMDEIDNVLYCLLNMLYYNEKTGTVEQEQISIVLGDRFVLTFQEDATRDVFNPIRDRIKIRHGKIRQSKADYLCYALIDMIVDRYYVVMSKLGDRIESLEEEIIRAGNSHSLAKINNVRKELIVLKRNVLPVKDLVNGFIKCESDLLEDRTTKYFKDVYDHISQANDLTENYRDMMINLHDLYVNNINLKMNEVMKVMAVVTCLLAPATVIGGIFGMNFDRIPYLHDNYGFYLAVASMLLIPLWMVIVFKRRGWF